MQGVLARQQVQQRQGQQHGQYGQADGQADARADLGAGAQQQRLVHGVQSMTLPLRANRPAGVSE